MSKETKVIPDFNIGVDLDEVMVDTRQEIKKRVIRIGGFGKINADEWINLNRDRYWGKIIQRLYRNPSVYEMAMPKPGAIKVIKEWCQAGYGVWPVTARPKNVLETVTLNWLDNYGLASLIPWTIFYERPFEDPFPTAKVIAFKEAVTRKYGFRVFVEDNLSIISQIFADTLLVRILLSENRTRTNADFVTHVYSWPEINLIVCEAVGVHKLQR